MSMNSVKKLCRGSITMGPAPIVFNGTLVAEHGVCDICAVSNV